MKMIFSFATFQQYYADFEKNKDMVEAAINDSLQDRSYGSIRFLTGQFSALSFVEPKPPEILDTHTLLLIVGVDGLTPAHLAQALVRGLDDPKVPKDLFLDVKRVLQKEKWIN